jgi:hypothetical protein
MSSPILSDALTIPVVVGSGATAGFHIIKSIAIDDINQVMVFNISSYVDQNSYLSGMSVLNQTSLSTQVPTDYQAIMNASSFIQGAYSFLASLPYFNQSQGS